MKLNRKMSLIPLMLLSSLTGCNNAKPTEVKVLIIPKFEIDEMSGDDAGEAQLFYEQYCKDAKKEKIDHLPETASFYMNKDNGVGLLITGSGKTAAGLSVAAVLNCKQYDFSKAYIISVGCGGGSANYTVLGDVVLGTYVCDYDLGHHVDSTEIDPETTPVPWFHDDSYDTYCHNIPNRQLTSKVYDLIKDIPLQTTELAKTTMMNNYPDWDRASQNPKVIKGTMMSGDNFWKGQVGHDRAVYIAEYHHTPDPYAITEMEEIAVMNTVNLYGLHDRTISLRVAVNLDVFLDGETPESIWATEDDFNTKVVDENSETLDIFEPSMHNLFNTTKVVIDAILNNTF